ncbi:PQQ-dependent sugar dehydrogenase [Neolewinella litorea]|nr:PQQ-dependent sugar dehydrogenase [Neolewinella litorea]
MLRLLLFLFAGLPLTLLYGQGMVVLEPLKDRFNQPTDIVSDGVHDSLLYVVEKGGLINRYDLVEEAVGVVLDLTDRVDTRSEGGALGMAFHPDYPDSNYVYVNYTVPGDEEDVEMVTHVSRFTLDNTGLFDDLSERILLTIDQPAVNHNAGDLAFGPDGYLYVPTGDGGAAGDRFRNGQNPESLLGKMLRIDVDGTSDGKNYLIPADNPFVGAADTLDEIWALGLRNPWRISFDRETGDLWIADVGQGAREEVNMVPAGHPGGLNFGWNCREGLIPFAGAEDRCAESALPFTDPLFDYPHEGNNGIDGRSITGGFVYRGPDGGLKGLYVFGDFVLQRLFVFDPVRETELQVVYTDLPATNISTFGEGSDGSLYLADFDGTLYEVTSDSGTAVRGGPEAAEMVTIYPNPARERVTVEFPHAVLGTVIIRLVNGSGQTIRKWSEQRVSGGRLELGVKDLPAGTYLLTAETEQRRYRSRLVLH